MNVADLIQTLLDSDEPSIRWKVHVHVLGEDPRSRALKKLQAEIRASLRARKLLEGFDSKGNLPGTSSPYAKWKGAHWVLATLADLGYPPGDQTLFPLRDRVCETWLDPFFYTEFAATKKAEAYQHEGVPVMQGRHRRCASQQGNALFFLTRLGLADARVEKLVERLRHWQWPDGGWNCDKEPSADTSSFMETMLPMCGLAVHAEAAGDKAARRAADRAAEVFLGRGLFRRRTNGRIIHPEFLQLHYPLYWHYDILGGLKAMRVVGKLADPRCGEALDRLESKQLPTGGWPAEKKYYHVSRGTELGAESVAWGGTSKKAMNPWVTVDALAVLTAAGRLAV